MLKELEIQWTLRSGISEEEKDNLMDAFIEEIEKYELLFGGSLKEELLSGVIDFSHSSLDAEGVKQLMQTLYEGRFSELVTSISSRIAKLELE